VGLAATGAAAFAALYAAYRNKKKLHVVLQPILKHMNPAQKNSVVKKCNDLGIKGNTPEEIVKNVDSMSKKTAKKTMEKIHVKEDTPNAETVSMMSFMKSRYSQGAVILLLAVLAVLGYKYNTSSADGDGDGDGSSSGGWVSDGDGDGSSGGGWVSGGERAGDDASEDTLE
jgi:uncharacterized membrane protein YgcG